MPTAELDATRRSLPAPEQSSTMAVLDRLWRRVQLSNATRRVVGYLPERWTVLRPGPGQAPPPPAAFAAFGRGSWVVPPATVFGAGSIEIGDGVALMEHSSLLATGGGRLVIGDRSHLARFVTIWCTVGVSIGADVLSSDYAVLTDTWGRPGGDTDGRPDPWPAAPIVVEGGAYLGAGSIIGPGVRVGRGAFIGENAVVTEDVPAHAVVYGNPARVTRHLDPVAGWVGEMFP